MVVHYCYFYLSMILIVSSFKIIRPLFNKNAVHSSSQMSINLFLQKKLPFQKISHIRSLNTDLSTEIDPEILPLDELSQLISDVHSLRGTPELVDRLEGWVKKYPGLESKIELYRLLYPFKLDTFQEEGLNSLIAGSNVLVTTPTGSGKTLVGELAIYFALLMGLKVAYTTPLKALSNQKYQDFRNRFGGDRVGLLTGDIVINRGAPITIMTTEVFRNIIYDDDSHHQLSKLFMVCFDEFHFMNDADRGTVWEESIISCPPSVRILALSATMGNANDIREWIASIHGPTDLIESTHRPVPLRYTCGLKQGLFPLFRDPNAGPGALSGLRRDESGKLDAGCLMNPSILKAIEQSTAKGSKNKNGNGKASNPSTASIPKYSDIVEELDNLQQLPAIFFIFSRTGCEDAANFVLQSKLKLLTATDVQFVNQAINSFVLTNPDIPVSKSSVALLRRGIGVHHAGLITVWKAFIEDLFNANKIKVLFATETLAAGVNMPARTTVITSVTKRINSEIVKLKTSQLLQMAGRAGRRGKDVEGFVVILKNRFEDVQIAHKILTSAIDGIKSHFKTSYGLTIKLLEKRSFAECKALVQKGFGSYVLQKRANKMKSKSVKVDLNEEMHRSILQKYTLPTAREFLKFAKRLDKEKRNYEFLIEKLEESEKDLVRAIASYMPMGTAILLRNSESGFFLGEVRWGSNDEYSGYGVFTRNLKMYLVNKEHIRSFSDGSNVLPGKTATDLFDIISYCTEWNESFIEECSKPYYEAEYSIPVDNVALIAALSFVEAKTVSVAIPATPAAIVKQQAVFEEALRDFETHPIVRANESEKVIHALKYASQLRDPFEFVKNGPSSTKKGSEASSPVSDGFAWKMFLNVHEILKRFGAMNETTTTELGQMVGSLTAENELWMALVLQNEVVQTLSAGEIAGLVCGIITDGYKSSSAFFKNKPSDRLLETVEALEPSFFELKAVQSELSIDFPVYLSIEMAGLVDSWVNGTSWRDLCKETSLDQGDMCRMFRRTVEALRQIPNAYGVPLPVVQLAFDAATKMDRFPVADMDLEVGSGLNGSLPETRGLGFDRGVARVEGDVNEMDFQFDGDDEISGMESIDELTSASTEDELFNRIFESIDLKGPGMDPMNGNLSEYNLDDILSILDQSNNVGRKAFQPLVSPDKREQGFKGRTQWNKMAYSQSDDRKIPVTNGPAQYLTDAIKPRNGKGNPISTSDSKKKDIASSIRSAVVSNVRVAKGSSKGKTGPKVVLTEEDMSIEDLLDGEGFDSIRIAIDEDLLEGVAADSSEMKESNVRDLDDLEDELIKLD